MLTSTSLTSANICYQTDWSAFYAPGAEIRRYLEDVVDNWKLMRYMRLQHELVYARYDEPSGKWFLRFRRPSPNSNADDIQFEEFEDVADILFTGIGSLSRWSWPTIEGLDSFKGRLVHSAQWDVNDGPWEDGVKDWDDKTVGVIGVVCAFRRRTYQPKEVKVIAGIFRYSSSSGPSAARQKALQLRPGKNVDLTPHFSPQICLKYWDVT